VPYLVLLVTATLNILGTLQGSPGSLPAACTNSNLRWPARDADLLMFGVLIVHLLWPTRRAEI